MKPTYPFAESGSHFAHAGNRVRPWVDGLPAFQRICEAIESASARRVNAAVA